MNTEKLLADLETAKRGLHDLLVAVRGGGDLRAAMAAGQATLDGLNTVEADPAPAEAGAAAEAAE